MKKIAIDEMIQVKGLPATAGSHIMDGFEPLFSAEVVSRLEDKGYEISEMTPVGEFGLDLVGEFSYGHEQEGSLAGAAATRVAEGAVCAALACDMTGAPRRAAALAGTTFLKPTYGTVSRYGLISCAASGEQIGVHAKDASGVAEIMGVIAGHDDKDGTSLREESYSYSSDEALQGKKVALIRDLTDKADAETQARVQAAADALKKAGVTVEEIDGKLFEEANIAWEILMAAETCNNVSRYDGVKFGFRADKYRNIDELYINSRTEGFNFLTKSVILYGSNALSKSCYTECYDKSLRVRRVLADAMKEIFAKYDAILLPACGKTAYEAYAIDDAFAKVFEESIYTAIANLIGIPAIVAGGVQMMAAQFGESTLLSLAQTLEKEGA